MKIGDYVRVQATNELVEVFHLSQKAGQPYHVPFVVTAYLLDEKGRRKLRDDGQFEVSAFYSHNLI